MYIFRALFSAPMRRIDEEGSATVVEGNRRCPTANVLFLKHRKGHESAATSFYLKHLFSKDGAVVRDLVD